MTALIEAKELRKSFGELKAVVGISLNVPRGEVLGFLGPNGAGKSTTMKMLTGFLEPDSGSARIAGYDVLEQPKLAKSKLGYLPEGAPLYAEMTPRALLQFVAGLRGFEKHEAKRRAGIAVERTGLEPVLDRTIETLSKGFKRRVGLAQAIVHDPKVLILDEPTDGLDPLQKHEVRTLIGEIAREKTIVISTHILEEVDAVCTRAIIIARGKLVADDTPSGLRSRAPSGRLDDVFRAVAA
jgi:ABC-2 type transport system ATP-binding protein